MNYGIDFSGTARSTSDEHDAACNAAERILAGRGREAHAASGAIAAGCVGWRRGQDSITMVIA